KLLEDLKELAEYDQFTSTDRPIFLNDNEDHPVQNRESPENSSEENIISKTNQEPPQDSNMHQLIDECCVEVLEEQKQNMEKTMLDLVKICHHKQFLCIHDEVDNLIESALDSKLLSINSQRLDKKEQEVKNIEEQPAELTPILSTKEPENSLSMGYEHLSITPETKSDEVTESNAKNLLPIPSECEVTLEDKSECDELICENSSTIIVCDNHSEILFDSNNDDLSSDEESFEDIEYVDASVPDPAIDSPSISRPPPEPPDDNFDLEPKVISEVMEVIDEPDKHFNPGGEIFISTKIEDDDYFPFIFVIRFFLPYLIFPEISPLFLSAESEDTIFDPGISK
nr:hypothetical protein [Tanacetum cinerariifolium]